MKKLSLLFLVCLSCPAVSQSTVPTDTASVSRYIQLGDSSKLNQERITAYQQALTLANQLDYPRGILNATLKIGEYYVKNEKIDSALRMYKTAIPTLQTDKALLAILYLSLGADLEKKSSYDSARFFVNEGLRLAQQVKDQNSIVRGYVVLGNFELNKYAYDNAFAYYAKADSICEADPKLKISKQHARVYNYLGYAVRVTHGYEKTEEFYNKAKSMYQSLNYELGVQEVNIGLAQLYNTQKKYDDALTLINEAVAYNKDYGTINSYTYALIVRGYIFLQMKRMEEARKDYQLYYDVVFAGEDKTLQRRATYYMGYFYESNGEFAKAIEYFTKAIALCKEQGDTRNLKQAYEGLINIYKQTQNLEHLSNTYEDYIALRNEIDRKEKEHAIYELETKYQTSRKEQEIALLTEQNKVTAQQKKSQLYLLVSLLVIAVTLGGMFYYAYRNKIRTAAKLEELDELKSRFFANISHEFRTPLTLIKSPLQHLQSQVQTDENQKQLALIDQNANRMLTLVDQLLELSRLDSGKLKLVLKREHISSLLHTIIEPFAYQAQTKSIEFTFFIKPSEEKHWVDRDVLEKILSNLLINAIKYTPANERVMVEGSMTGHQMHLTVANSGVELNPSDVDKLFERFYRQNSSSHGAGIGLSLVKELVTLYRGTLSSDVRNNTLTFRITLPTDPGMLKDTCVLSEESQAEEPRTAEINNQQELPILLIAEDNVDVRLILYYIFKNDYRVMEASDGEKALKIARQEVPDVVISDVMMPRMNGYDLCKNLKENEITSFIPVVLLTARTGDEAHLEGLQNQADAFITKPFNHDILTSTVKQLLEERRRLRERYSKELVLKPKDITVSTVDEKFVGRLQKILDAHLGNPAFSTDQFAKEAGLSRMQLHRKLKSLLGVSATEFLRNERLRAASELLKKPNINVSEVAYAVGFNDADYFTQCFKEKYGTTPTVYMKSPRTTFAQR